MRAEYDQRRKNITWLTKTMPTCTWKLSLQIGNFQAYCVTINKDNPNGPWKILFIYLYFDFTSWPYMPEYNVHICHEWRSSAPCPVYVLLAMRCSNHWEWYLSRKLRLNRHWSGRLDQQTLASFLPSLLLPLPPYFCNFNFPRTLTSLFRLFPLLC